MKGDKELHHAVRLMRFSETATATEATGLSTGRAKGRRALSVILATCGAAGLLLFVVKGRVSNEAGTALSKQAASKADANWEAFKLRYSKKYESAAHEAERRASYEDRVADLEMRNALNGREVFGVTEHSDRPRGAKAFARGFGGHVRLDPSLRKAVKDIDPIDEALELRASVDWRRDDRGVVTPVKNQGQCGSCWAFSATEQIESQLVLAGAPAVELSPQQVASCTQEADVGCCFGCGGGDPTAAYEYVASLKQGSGLAQAELWPYSAPLTPQEDECLELDCTGACNKDVSILASDYGYLGPFAQIDGYAFATPECTNATSCADQNLHELALRLHEFPLSVCLNAEVWDDYVGGILTANACGGSGMEDLDHCVQLVGYNNEDPENAYWIVRNSWSGSWGEAGYIYLEFGQNTCGVANEATLVHVAGGFALEPDEPVLYH